jgi:tetratricopeptide (TPR) repeat protein
MATDNPRLDELRRRVQQDPASIAFAPLAEELRRSGEYYEAVRVCLAGLELHPAFLSARVTLGRALAALDQYREARVEFDYVLEVAPDNLLARKSLTELEEHLRVAAPQPDPSLEELDGWLARIEADRAERAASGGSHSPRAGGGFGPREDGGGSPTRNPS